MRTATTTQPTMPPPAPSRRQSARQARTNSTRPANYYARSFAGRLASLGGVESATSSNTAPGFFPAITHFTDSVAALPKELIKHFSMFKEVEAKIHDPEQVLKVLFDEIARLPVPTIAQRQQAAQNQQTSTGNNSVPGSVAGSLYHDSASLHQQLAVELFPENLQSLPPQEQADLYRRQLFFRLRMVIASMLPTLDEKLVVLTSANQTKNKGLARMDSSFPHIENEISEEARCGSLTHWAYAEKEEKKKGGTTSERTRRDVVSTNNLAAAAAAVHEGDLAASRSEARREAMLANKRSRNHHLDSDFDEGRTTKKTQSRARKGVETTSASDPKAYGLGISNGIPQPSKRRKTEKATAPAMERTVSSSLNYNGPSGRASPRETPAAEVAKKKARAAPVPVPAKKRSQAVGASPPLASSPLTSGFVKEPQAQRPQATRVRQNSISNSIHSVAQDSVRNRPSSSASNRPANGNTAVQELEQAASINMAPVTAKDNSTVGVAGRSADSAANDVVTSAALKREETEIQDTAMQDAETSHMAPVVTRAGRASKTATPVTSTFPDVPMARSRSTRNHNTGGSHTSSESNVAGAANVTQAKRSHKKGASALQTAGSVIAKTTNNMDPEDDNSSIAAELSDEVGEDGDEPRYCYCNGVSYGDMVACDNEQCAREWFHLDCVGMSKAPSSKTKWYCDECKENMKKSRPGSRQ